jgi:hypothetical protein
MRNDDPGLDGRVRTLNAPGRCKVRGRWRGAPPYATPEIAGEVPGKSSAFVRIFESGREIGALGTWAGIGLGDPRADRKS